MTEPVCVGRLGKRLVVIGLLTGLAACGPLAGKTGNAPATTQSAPAAAQAPGAAAPAAGSPSYQPVTDIPIPPGTKINTERSVILGGPDRWFGRMVLILDRSTTLAYAYYLEQMPAFGWEPITAIQGRTSNLTYVRGERASTIEIGPSGLRGAEVAITVSPRSTPAAAAGGSAAPKK